MTDNKQEAVSGINSPGSTVEVTLDSTAVEADRGEVFSKQEQHYELTEVLETNRGERHIVVLQDYPDPDAISSALAHQLISARYDIKTN